MWLIFAQSTNAGVDAFTGGSLIVSIINGGVLGWLLLIGLPAKDKLLKEKDDLLSKTINGLVETHRQSMREIAAEFRGVNEKLVEHCDNEHAAILASYDKQVERIIAVMRRKPEEG